MSFNFVDSPQTKFNILNVLTTPRDNNLNLYRMEKEVCLKETNLQKFLRGPSTNNL